MGAGGGVAIQKRGAGEKGIWTQFRPAPRVFFQFVFFAGLTLGGSPSRAQLVDGLANRYSVIAMPELMADFFDAKVIIIGETHEAGLEKTLIHQILSSSLNQTPNPTPEVRMQSVQKTSLDKLECLVETYSNLVHPYPELKLIFEDVCNDIESLVGNGPSQTTFEKSLKRLKTTSRRVLTYSGYRHTLPWGDIFEDDFVPAKIDVTSNNTIVTQLPKEMRESVLTVSFVPQDTLILTKALAMIDRMAGWDLKKIQLELPRYRDEFSNLLRSPLGFDETFRVFRIEEMEKKFAIKSRLVVINHQMEFKERMTELLTTPLLASFLSAIDSDKWHFTAAFHRTSGIAGRTFEPGSVILLGVTKDGKNKILVAQKDHEPVIETFSQDLRNLLKNQNQNFPFSN